MIHCRGPSVSLVCLHGGRPDDASELTTRMRPAPPRAGVVRCETATPGSLHAYVAPTLAIESNGASSVTSHLDCCVFYVVLRALLYSQMTSLIGASARSRTLGRPR